MAIATPRPLKRKHVDGEAGISGSGKKSKEERRAEKRAKREAEAESPVRRKHKANGISSRGSLAAGEDDTPDTSRTEFKLVRARTNVSIPPRFAGDARRGAEEILDNLVMRYVPSLQGVLLSHKNLTFTQNVTIMYAEGPYPTTAVEFDAGVWAPEVGMRIVGRISLHATDHIGLLVHRTFNVSIDRAHIPGDGEWEYVHGPVANDPELGGEEAQDDEESGRWIHTQTGEPLGGESGLVEFTVIGYTVANQMLSLHGSLQPDPFAPEHYTVRQNTVQPVEADQSETEVGGANERVTEDSENEPEVMEEELAAPRGKRRKVVDVAPVALEPKTAPTKKKKKKSVVEGEANVVMAEAASTVVEGEEKKKRKKKRDKAVDA